MKTTFYCSILFAIVISFTSCGLTDPDVNDECEIYWFDTGGKEWQISGTDITIVFPKGTIKTELTPFFAFSSGASAEPQPGVPQNFFTASGVRYVVTAEDGTSKKTYTARATVATSK